MKIFISYRRADSKFVVDRIRDRLVAVYGEQSVFRDIESIPIGQDFRTVLAAETKGCNVMLVVIGPQWAGITYANGEKRLFDPADYTRIEIETGLTQDKILVIPVLVMNALMPGAGDVPESLRDLTYRNAISVRNDPDFNHDIQRLVNGINLATTGTTETLTIQYFEPETVYISQGEFWMGSPEGTDVPAHEVPQHQVFLPAYRIGKYPVTNKQYEEFVRETGTLVSPSMGWDGQKVTPGLEKHPAAGVTFYNALAYCQWLSKKTGRKYSIPNEAQWEKTCRGGSQNIYPWGNEFNAARCNYGQPNLAPVDMYPAQNDYGCFDLVGNVRQWTCSLWGEKRVIPDPRWAYPWKDDGRNDPTASSQIRRVVRGSAMKDNLNLLRCSARSGQAPDDIGVPGARAGFRVVLLES